MVEYKRGLRGKKTNIITAFEPVNVTKVSIRAEPFRSFTDSLVGQEQVRAAWREDLERDLKVLKKWTTETRSFKSLLECSKQFEDAYKKTEKETKQAQDDADLHPEDEALRMKAIKLTKKIKGYIRDDRETREMLGARANASSTWAKKLEDTLLDYVDSSSDHELNTVAIRVKYELRKLINLLEAGQPPVRPPSTEYLRSQALIKAYSPVLSRQPRQRVLRARRPQRQSQGLEGEPAPFQAFPFVVC